RRAGLPLAANKRARRVLIEGAWSYRYPARVSQTMQARLEGLSKAVREIAWKAQIRLCARYRRLTAAGKKLPVVIAAIAREMAAFLWAIARHVAPAACSRKWRWPGQTASGPHPILACVRVRAP